ncbi:phage tail protein [Pseudoalteromonas xiamenensis]|uniref:phage tail-collar fiber domain-containing protein n=1 Tax=Pseudoalteromonas xiamenensis TaxID=882626 RepID=UPI0035EE7187
MSHTEYWTTLTANGRQKVLAAIAQQGKIEISHFAVGDGTIGESHTDLTSLKYRNEISSLHVVSGESALVEMFAVVPADVGGFYVREGAFYTSDGEAFAIIKYPETYKPDASDNAAAELGIRAIVDVEQAQVVTEKIDPSMVYASREWVKRTLSNDLALLQDEIEKNAANLTELDSKLNNKGIATKWQDLTGSVGHAFETEYNSEKYVVKNPMDDVAIAPPPFAGRSYIEQNGTNSYVKLKSPIVLQAGDEVKFKFEAPTESLSVGHYLVESGLWMQLAGSTGKYQYNSANYTAKVDGVLINTNTDYPVDGLVHDIEIAIVNSLTINSLAAKANGTQPYKGRIYDLEIIRNGQRIHYFPLTVDALDYHNGNLVKDEAFNHTGNFLVNSGKPIFGNGAAINGSCTFYAPFVEPTAGTLLVVYEIDNFVSGTVKAYSDNAIELSSRSANGVYSEIIVQDYGANGVGFAATDFVGTLKNLRVIKLNELSPSASFKSASGLDEVSSGVTFNSGYVAFDGASTNKQVVFNGAYRFSVKAGQSFRFALKVNGATKGTLRAQSLGTSDANVEFLSSGDGVKSVNITAIRDHLFTPFLITVDGWNGNVEYWSVTEVTDGEVIGEPKIVYENHWAKQLDSKDIGTKSDIDVGTSTKLVPSAKAVKEALIEQTAALQSSGIGTIWQDLTGSVGHAFETEYNGEKYVVKNPIDDVTIAPPDAAGRSYIKFDGLNDYINIPAINMLTGDVLKLKYSGLPIGNTGAYLLDGSTATNRLFLALTSTGLYSTAASAFTVDGVASASGQAYRKDPIIKQLVITPAAGATLGKVGARYNNTEVFTGRIFDLEVIRNSKRIQYFPLRGDAVDYGAGNLIKDEEFTYAGNWSAGSGWSVVDNKALAVAGTQSTISHQVEQINRGDTVRILFDIDRVSGTLSLPNTGLANISGGGLYDKVAVFGATISTFSIVKLSDFAGSIKNLKVIKLKELSPSASFSSATGFALSGGVTITGGQAVFGSGGGSKYVAVLGIFKAGVKYRVVYKTNSTTKGTYYLRTGTPATLYGDIRSADGTFDAEITLAIDSSNLLIYTADGWDGNVEYFSVTEVTDGEIIGEPEIAYENHWAKQLDSKDIGTKSDIDTGTSTKIVPHVKAIKEAINEAVLPINEKLSKTTHALSKSIDLSSQVQNSPYRKSVIALCQLNSPYANFNSFSEGVIRGHRSNSLHPDITAHIAVAKRYASDGMRGNVLLKGGLREVKLCTFMYKGNKYGGLHFFYDIAEHQTIAFDGLSNFDIFGLDYINTQTGEKLNAEVADSLRFDGIAVDDELYFNESEVLRKKQLATGEESLAGTSTEKAATPKGVALYGAQHGLGNHLSLTSSNFITRSFDLNIAGGSRVLFPDLPDNACDILVHGLTDGTETYTSFVGRFVKYGSTWSAVNIYGATGSLNYPTIEIFNNKPHFKNPHVYAFSFSFNCQIACQNAGAARPFEFYQNLYSPANLPTKLVDGDLSIEKNEFGALRATVPYGTMDCGALNGSHWHFYTSLPSFYFARPAHFAGELYAGSNAGNRVYHEGNKPTASDVGAFKEHKRGITVSNSEYTTIAKVTGERFSSIITMTLFGTADSTVVSFKADLLVHHFKQVYVYSQNGGYSAISLKILSDSNEKYCIQAMVIGSKSAPLICTIQAFANEVIEFNPADILGFTNEHIHNSRKYGYAITSKYDSTGISINGNEVADASNIHQLLQSSVSKPTSGSLSLGENHLTTNNTIKLPATTNLAVDSVVKVTKRFAVTPQIEVDNPTTDKIAFFKDRVVQFDTAISFDIGAILTFILNDKKEWELQ